MKYLDITADEMLDMLVHFVDELHPPFENDSAEIILRYLADWYEDDTNGIAIKDLGRALVPDDIPNAHDYTKGIFELARYGNIVLEYRPEQTTN